MKSNFSICPYLCVLTFHLCIKFSLITTNVDNHSYNPILSPFKYPWKKQQISQSKSKKKNTIRNEINKILIKWLKLAK
jgi:hypothetical protein